MQTGGYAINSLQAWGERSVNPSLLLGTGEPVPWLGFLRDMDFLESAGHKLIENQSFLQIGGNIAVFYGS